MSFWSSLVSGVTSAAGSLGSILGYGSAVRTPPMIFGGSPAIVGMAGEAIWADPWVQPWRGPLDLDRDGREDAAMRLLFREAYRKEPSVRSAVQGKVNATASLDLTVTPRNRRRVEDCKAAEFVKWSIENSERGIFGLVQDILTPAFVDGWSLAEVSLNVVDDADSDEWKGFWTLRQARPIDSQYMRLQLDQYRNDVGVVNLVRGVQRYEPAKTLLFTHNGWHNNPFGQSDLRAVIRAVHLIEDAYRVWFIAIKRFGLPYFHGKVSSTTNRRQLEEALKELYAGGWAVTSDKDAIEVLNLSSAANFKAFEEKINKLREDVFLAIRGVYLPFLEGQGGAGSHGDTSVHKVARDAQEDVIQKQLCHLLNRKLVPFLVRPNFGMGVGLPKIALGGTNWGEVKQRGEVFKIALNDCRLSLSKTQVYDDMKCAPPEMVEGLDDELKPPEQPGAMGGGMPGMNGAAAGIPESPSNTGGGTSAPAETPAPTEEVESMFASFSQGSGDYHDKWNAAVRELCKEFELDTAA